MLDLDAIFDPDSDLSPSQRPHMHITPDDLPADWHFRWDERAGIMEYDGGLTTEYAEAEALKDILRQMEAAGVFPMAGAPRLRM